VIITPPTTAWAAASGREWSPPLRTRTCLIFF
jgi:hypothetical protein